MIFFKPVTLLLLFFLCADVGMAQTKKIQILSSQLQQAKSKEERLTRLLALLEEYQSLNRDTLYKLALEARELSALQLDINKKGLAAVALSDAYMRWGWTDSALAAFEPLLTSEKNYNKHIYLKIQRRKAMVYAAHSDMKKALEILFPALSGSEIEKDTLNTAAIMNSIGSIKMAYENIGEALEWIQKAAKLCSGSSKYKTVQAAVYTNAANAYFQNTNIDSALYFIERAVPLCRETENLYVLATALRIKSSLLVTKKRFSEAEAALKEMLAARKLTTGESIYIEDNLLLSDFYAKTGQLEKAIEFCRQFLQTGNVYDTTLSKSVILTNDPKIRLEYWKALARYYKQGNRLPEYKESLEQIILLKDSFYLANSAQAIADAETKYEVQKKENTILQQKYSLQRSRFFLIGSVGLLVMAILVTYFIFRDYRHKQKVKMETAMAEEHAKAEMAVKEAEEKERMRIAADLHDNLGVYAASIASNLSYIQMPEADENTITALSELKNNSQSIISQLNDTIWVMKKESLSLTSISDRLKVFINRIQKSYPATQIEVEERIETDSQLPSSQAFHLYRMVQEAINNALKHSGAKNIKVTFNANSIWKVTVADDGGGMNTDQSLHNSTGNGLINMKERSKEAGWTVHWQSAKDRGTVVEIAPVVD